MKAQLLSDEINEGIERFRREMTPELNKMEAMELLIREQLIALGIIKPDEEPEPWEIN